MAFLNKNRWLNIPIIEALERGEGRLLAFDHDGAVVMHHDSGVLFSLNSDEALLRYGELIENHVCTVYNARDLELIESLFPEKRHVPCHQMLYVKPEPPDIDSGLDFRLLDSTYAQFIFDTYSRRPDNIEHIVHLLDKKYVYGVFTDGKIAGYCGRHSDGSMGLLEILPDYRRRGLGREMEKFIIRDVLSEGRTPFGHVVYGNEVSLSLQKSIDGVVFIPECVHWVAKKRKTDK